MTHRLQLFDTPQSLAESVAAFLVEGYEQGDNLLIVAKPQHRDAILAAVHQHGCFQDAGPSRQRLIAMDAEEVLRHISTQGAIDEERFESTVGSLVGRLAGSGRLRIYGEIVEVLAEQGDFDGAVRLETLWNNLASRVPFLLMCGYSSAHFTASPIELRRICRTHSDIRVSADDTLGSYLLTTA